MGPRALWLCIRGQKGFIHSFMHVSSHEPNSVFVRLLCSHSRVADGLSAVLYFANCFVALFSTLSHVYETIEVLS